MKVIREKTEILLMEYACGALDEACSLLVASYVTICPEARRYMKECESYGGAMIEHCCDPVAMHRDSMKAVLARLDEQPQPEQENTAAPSAFCREQDLPDPLSHHIDGCGQPSKWRSVYPGIRYCPLPVNDSAYSMRLVRMAPRARAVRHTHPGTEYTLVLQGGYHDEFGTYNAGDLVVIEDHITHRPVAGDEGCLCLTATDRPVHFSGPFGPLFSILMR